MHDGRKPRCFTPSRWQKVWFIIVHVCALKKKEVLYATHLHMNVVHQLVLGEIGEKEKMVNFAIVFYLLKEGCPLMNYKYLKDLFSFLK